jgi:hypothetical protein
MAHGEKIHAVLTCGGITVMAVCQQVAVKHFKGGRMPSVLGDNPVELLLAYKWLPPVTLFHRLTGFSQVREQFPDVFSLHELDV